MSGIETIVDGAFDLATVLVMLGVVVALARAIRGPHLADRVVAVDLVTMLGVSLIALRAIATDQPWLVDVVFSLALVGFLATTAFARWLDARARRAGREEGGS